MKTKVLFVLPQFSSTDATHYQHIFELLSILASEMDLFVFIERSTGAVNIPNVTHIYKQKFVFPIINLFERVFCFTYLRFLGYKKVYVHYSYWSAIISSLIFRSTRSTVFYWHCEVFDNFFARGANLGETLKKVLFDQIPMILTLRAVNYLVTGSNLIAQSYSSTFGISRKKIQVIPNFINLDRFTLSKSKDYYKKTLGISKGTKVLLFVHKLAPRKGADRLVSILKGVLPFVPKVKLILIGVGQLSEELVNEFKGESLAESVLFVGSVPNSQILPYFGAADLFILPSRQEGFPRVLLESMALGVPFVATDVGGVREICNKLQKEFLVEKNDMETFTKKVVFLINNRELLSKLSHEGINRVKTYDINKVARQFLKLFA